MRRGREGADFGSGAIGLGGGRERGSGGSASGVGIADVMVRSVKNKVIGHIRRFDALLESDR